MSTRIIKASAITVEILKIRGNSERTGLEVWQYPDSVHIETANGATISISRSSAEALAKFIMKGRGK